MNCLDCHPGETPAMAVGERCGAGLCAERLIESDEYLTSNMPIRVPVPASPPARKLRCARCAGRRARPARAEDGMTAPTELQLRYATAARGRG